VLGLDRAEPFPRELGGESLELLEMLGRKSLQPFSSFNAEVQPHDTVVRRIPQPSYQPRLFCSIDQTYDAVMAKKEIVGHFADGRTPWVGVPADSQEQLVLCRREPGGSSLLLAPPLKVTESGPQGEQASVDGI
jgi:hypothetical protein